VNPQNEPLLLSDVQAAALCGCSRSHWHVLAAAGKIPPSIKLGRKRLWRRQEIESWILAGCPDSATWQAMQASVGRRMKIVS
jgi:predicted DNA-binding transcriptional regulator AlpA